MSEIYRKLEGTSKRKKKIKINWLRLLGETVIVILFFIFVVLVSLGFLDG